MAYDGVGARALLAGGPGVLRFLLQPERLHLVRVGANTSTGSVRRLGADLLFDAQHGVVAENEDWDTYYTYRREQRQLRLYGQSASNTQAIEAYVINSQPVHLQSLAVSCISKHSQLPLAV